MEANQMIRVEVHRRLDNRPNLPDDSPLGWELHKRPSQTLHEVLDGDPNLRVADWGETDDTVRTHEATLLQIILNHLDPVTVNYAMVAGATWLGTKLADKGFDAVWTAGVKRLMSKLRKPQEEKRIQEITIFRENEDFIISIRPPDQGGSIYLRIGGERPDKALTFDYDYVAEKPIVRQPPAPAS